MREQHPVPCACKACARPMAVGSDVTGRHWSRTQRAQAFEWLRALAVADDAPHLAGVAFDTWADLAALQAANPLGGEARMFEVMASRIRAGEPTASVLQDYGLTRVAKPTDVSEGSREHG